jgi:hypothetical protein
MKQQDLVNEQNLDLSQFQLRRRNPHSDREICIQLTPQQEVQEIPTYHNAIKMKQ